MRHVPVYVCSATSAEEVFPDLVAETSGYFNSAFCLKKGQKSLQHNPERGKDAGKGVVSRLSVEGASFVLALLGLASLG